MNTIKRNFTHSGTETNFGDVELSFNDEGWSLNGQALPAASVRAIVNQGLQILQDTYAGVGKSKTVDEATAAFGKKLVALRDGTIGERGSAVDPLTRMIQSVAREQGSDWLLYRDSSGRTVVSAGRLLAPVVAGTEELGFLGLVQQNELDDAGRRVLERGAGGLEAHGVDVRDVVADDVHHRLVRAEPGDPGEH